jgi:hypothetical protein
MFAEPKLTERTLHFLYYDPNLISARDDTGKVYSRKDCVARSATPPEGGMKGRVLNFMDGEVSSVKIRGIPKEASRFESIAVEVPVNFLASWREFSIPMVGEKADPTTKTVGGLTFTVRIEKHDEKGISLAIRVDGENVQQTKRFGFFAGTRQSPRTLHRTYTEDGPTHTTFHVFGHGKTDKPFPLQVSYIEKLIKKSCRFDFTNIQLR